MTDGDTENPTGYAQVMEELQGGSAVRTYTWGHWLLSQTRSINNTATTSYYGYDGHGSVRFLTDASGAVMDTYDYDAFGKLTASSGSVANPYRYTAREYDDETGLYYYRARYYDAATGRFLSEDPIGFDGGGINYYSYVQNRPTNYLDPGGLKLTPAQCRDLFERITANVEKINERIRKYDPLEDGKGGHPYSAGGVVRTTVQGSHYAIILAMQARMWLDIARYQNDCKDGPKLPCEVFKTAGKKIPQPVYERSLLEFQLEEESARQEAAVWEKVLIGDYVAGTVATGGAIGIGSSIGEGIEAAIRLALAF